LPFDYAAHEEQREFLPEWTKKLADFSAAGKSGREGSGRWANVAGLPEARRRRP